MHPKFVEFVAAAFTVMPSDLEWQLSFENRKFHLYLRTTGPERMTKQVWVTTEFILDQTSAETAGRQFMTTALKGLSPDAVQPRSNPQTP